MIESIEKSFLINPLNANNEIYRDLLTLKQLVPRALVADYFKSNKVTKVRLFSNQTSLVIFIALCLFSDIWHE